MNYNNLPSDLLSLVFQKNREAAIAEKKKYDDWYEELDEDDKEELDEGIYDMYMGIGDYAGTDSEDEETWDGEPLPKQEYPDLDYLEGFPSATWDCMKLKDKRWFYDAYWRAYIWNYNIMISGNPY